MAKQRTMEVGELRAAFKKISEQGDGKNAHNITPSDLRDHMDKKHKKDDAPHIDTERASSSAEARCPSGYCTPRHCSPFDVPDRQTPCSTPRTPERWPEHSSFLGWGQQPWQHPPVWQWSLTPVVLPQWMPAPVEAKAPSVSAQPAQTKSATAKCKPTAWFSRRHQFKRKFQGGGSDTVANPSTTAANQHKKVKKDRKAREAGLSTRAEKRSAQARGKQGENVPQ